MGLALILFQPGPGGAGPYRNFYLRALRGSVGPRSVAAKI